MDLFGNSINQETQLLIAIGAAVAAGCEPCLTRMVGMASQGDVETSKIRTAAIIGQFVKDQTAMDMKKLADNLLGTHLVQTAGSVKCPMEDEEPAAEMTHRESNGSQAEGCGCGCG